MMNYSRLSNLLISSALLDKLQEFSVFSLSAIMNVFIPCRFRRQAQAFIVFLIKVTIAECRFS